VLRKTDPNDQNIDGIGDALAVKKNAQTKQASAWRKAPIPRPPRHPGKKRKHMNKQTNNMTITQREQEAFLAHT
jgi:hypothetical protein